MSSGATTLLFTDIEGSTRLWEQEVDGMSRALAAHDAVSRVAVESNHGVVVKMTGDGMYAAFDDPADALKATVMLQQALDDTAAAGGIALRVRAGLHVGIVERRDEDIFGGAVNRAARIMKAAHGGQILVSQSVVDRVGERLPSLVSLRDLGIVRLRDLATSERIYQLVHPRLRKDFPALRSLEATPNNLPQRLTSFIGRERELAEAKGLLDNSRLLTLLGTGGSGKTRLALQIGAGVLENYPDGVWFVDLAPLADAERLPSAVARTLGLMVQPGRSIIEALCEHVAGRQMLLLMDNCEHVLGACAALVKTLLDRASRLQILATSREALGLPGEQMVPVRSLSCPPPEREGRSDRVATFEAVQLFVDRARLVQPAFTLDATSGPEVAEICRRLDGIPLAIELAAARTKVCSVGELRTMLDDRFRLLVGGSTMVPPRQQTLLATIKWSFDLLTPDQRELLERLCVFSGGWTLESAAAVAARGAEQFAVLEQLTHLVDKSLIATHRTERDTTRYSMLETVRQYGLDNLAAAGADSTTAECHLEYFVALAERLAPAFGRSGEREALEELAPELENIVQALRDAERLRAGSDLGLRLVAALERYWMSLGLLDLGHRLTTQALSRRDAAQPSPAHARALFVVTRLAYVLCHNLEAQIWAQECLLHARALHDEHLEAGALTSLGAIAIDLGDLARGIALCEEALVIARKRADAERISAALTTLGVAHFTAGDLEPAACLFEEVLQIARDRSDPHMIANGACNLADAYMLRGQVRQASPLLLEALDMSSRAKSKWTMFRVLNTGTELAVAVQEWPAAARLLGAAEAARELLGRQQQRDEAQQWTTVTTAIRNSMPETDFEAGYAAGHALTLEEAIAETRAWLQKLQPEHRPVRPAAGHEEKHRHR